MRNQTQLSLLFSLIAIFFCNRPLLWAQMPTCGSVVSLENYCADACVVCDLNGVSGTTTHTIQGGPPPGFCTQVVHSIQYFAFVAGSTNLSFIVRVLGCTRGNSIELGVYESPDCSSYNLVSNCNTSMPVGSHSFTTTQPLKIGCVYYIVMDGNGPASCSFNISVTSGSGKAPKPSLVGSIQGKTKVCEGDIETYAIQSFFGACNTEWFVDNGDILSQSKNSVTVAWNGKGKGRVCIIGSNVCQETEECINVLIGENTEKDLGTFYTCPGTPYIINNRSYFEGIYDFRLKNFIGCDSIVNFEVAYHDIDYTDIDSTICYPDFLFINGKKYDQTGKFKEDLKKKAAPFCDSIINVNLTVMQVEPVIISSGNFTCSDSIVILHADSSKISGANRIEYIWRDSLGQIISTNTKLPIQNPGTYTLEIIAHAANGKSCSNLNKIQISGNKKSPDLRSDQKIILCENEAFDPKSIQIQDLNNTGANYMYYFRNGQNFIFLDQNQQINLMNDTSIFVIGSSGFCTDTLEIGIQIHKLPALSKIDTSICFGDVIDLSKNTIQNSFPNLLISEIYSQPIQEQKYIADKTIRIIKDTIFYIFVSDSICKKTIAWNINVKAQANPIFSILKKKMCEKDYQEVRFPKPLANEIKAIFVNQNQIPINDTFYRIPNLKKGKYIIRCLSSIDACTSERIDSFEVFEKPQSPELFCNSTDSSIVFYWKNYSSSHSIEILKIQSAGTINIFSDSIKISRLAPNEEAFVRIVLKDSICGDQVIESKCRSVQCPNIILQIQKIDTICLDTSLDQKVKLQYSISNPQQNWNLKFQGNGIDSSTGIFDPKIAGPGLHRITISYSNDFCQNQKQLFIPVRRQPKYKLTLDTVICINQAQEIQLLGEVDQDEIENFNLGDALLLNKPSSRKWQIQWAKSGRKQLKLKIQNGPCVQEFNPTINVLDAPEKANVQCKSTGSEILFYWNKQAYVSNSTIELSPNVPFQKLTDTSILISNLAPNSNIILLLKREFNHPCLNLDSIFYSCTSLQCPPINLLKDSTITACRSRLGQILNLQNLVTNGSIQGDWFYQKNKLSAEQLTTTTIEIGKSTIYFFGSKDNCFYEDSVQLIIGNIPEFKIEKNELDCTEENKLGEIRIISIDKGIPPYTHTLNGNISSNGIFDQLSAGNYLFILKDSLQCDTSINFTFTNPIAPEVNAGPDQEIMKGESASLKADIKGRYQNIEWFPKTEINCTNCINPIASPSESRWYIVEIEDSLQCRDLDSIYIKIRDHSIFIPNVFTPNFDGINDFFTIFGTDDVKSIRKAEIYDRWGELIFTKENFTLQQQDKENSWNGIYRGHLLTPGVYIYQVLVEFTNGETQKFAGDINLIR